MDDFEWTHPGMTLRTGAELQAARRAAAERFTAIAMSYMPEGYTVENRKSLSGRHCGKKVADPSSPSGHPQGPVYLSA
jgi:hypothetical protein